MSKRMFVITVIVIVALAAVMVAMHRRGGPIVNALHGLHGH
ncbi:MAG TPA: hypothetical protein VLT86_01470 [Vicinamibacterales bacterium]|nr:hypothetical protein [Vicinamibacterales bacterium]